MLKGSEFSLILEEKLRNPLLGQKWPMRHIPFQEEKKDWHKSTMAYPNWFLH